ncbi:MAG: hypothetical protein VX278_24240 [Myxococcota bacterium]|nr:hypothetical protein [Myxococcota bacterium]
MKLKRNITISSALTTEQFRTRLREHVEPVDDFQLISKLSGAGIVIRTLAPPKSEAPFFGMQEETIRIAELRYQKDLTPYQPIIKIQLTPRESGCTVSLSLAPHPKLFDLGWLYNATGILLLITSIPLFSQRLEAGLGALFFAFLLMVYPNMRAKISFEEAVASSLKRLKQLDLGWDQSEEQASSQ